MAFTEVLVRRAPARPLRVGTVLGVRGRSAKACQIRWADGGEERVRIDPATDRFAAEGTALLSWLLDPSTVNRRFQQDSEAVLVDLIRSGHGEPLSPAAMRKTLTDLGLSGPDVTAALRSAQPNLKRHKHIAVKGGTYAWSDEPLDAYAHLRSLSASAAFERLLGGRLSSDEKAVVIDVIRAGLGDPRADAVHAGELREAQDQKVRARGVQALASLAMEVEELVANGAEPDLLLERVRRSAATLDLTPIEAAGATASFDRRRHTPIVGSPADGTQVTVVRPGYSWRTPKEDVLVAKALVIQQ